jgi:hypothetical protein
MKKTIFALLFAFFATMGMMEAQNPAVPFPFQFSTDTGAGAIWYNITWTNDNPNPNAFGVDLANGVFGIDQWNGQNPGKESQLFCFIGDATNGFEIYSKSYLAGKQFLGETLTKDLKLQNLFDNFDDFWGDTRTVGFTTNETTPAEVKNKWFIAEGNGTDHDGVANIGYYKLYVDKEYNGTKQALRLNGASKGILTPVNWGTVYKVKFTRVTPYGLPIVASANTGAGAIWYIINRDCGGTDGLKPWVLDISNGRIGIAWGGESPTNNAQLFCFIGNETDGYEVYNKAALTGATINGTVLTEDLKLQNFAAPAWDVNLGFTANSAVTGNDLLTKWFIKEGNGSNHDGVERLGYYKVYNPGANLAWNRSGGSQLVAAIADWGDLYAQKFTRVTPEFPVPGQKYYIKNIDAGLYVSATQAAGDYPTINYQLASSPDFQFEFTWLGGDYFAAATRSNTLSMKASGGWDCVFGTSDGSDPYAIKLVKDASADKYKLFFKPQGTKNVGIDNVTPNSRLFTDKGDASHPWFEIIPVPDEITLGVSLLIPADGASSVSHTADLVVAFNDIITLGEGAISIKDEWNEEITGVTLSVDVNILTIKHAPLNPETTYTVTIPEGAITDFAGTSWSFTTSSAATLPIAGHIYKIKLEDTETYLTLAGDLPGGGSWLNNAYVGNNNQKFRVVAVEGQPNQFLLQDLNGNYFRGTNNGWTEGIVTDPAESVVFTYEVNGGYIHLVNTATNEHLGPFNKPAGNWVHFKGKGSAFQNWTLIDFNKASDKPSASVFHFDFTDLSVAYTESVPTGASNLKRLTDNDEQTVYTVNGVDEAQITVELEYPILLTSYGLAPAPGSTVDVADWAIERSLDGITWTPVGIATAADVQKVNDYGLYKTFTTSCSTNNGDTLNLARAKFFRLTATGNGKVEIGEWQLHGVPDLESTWPPHHLPDGLFGAYTWGTDDTANGTISGNSLLYNPWPAWYSTVAYRNLINGNLTDGYSVLAHPEGATVAPWVTFEFNTPVKAGTYAITASWEDKFYQPSQWNLWGTNDAGDDAWVLLDAQHSVIFPGEGRVAATLYYNIANADVYKKYKLELVESNGGDMVSFSKWQLFGDEGIISNPQVKSAFAYDYTDDALEINESSATSEDNLKLLTDNDERTIYKVAGANSTQIIVKTEYPILLTAYGLASSPASPVDVATWTVEASLDGTEWTPVTLSEQSKKPVFEYGLFKTFQTLFGDNDKYFRAQYFRLTATGNGNVEIGEWQLYGTPSVREITQSGWRQQDFPIDLTGWWTEEGYTWQSPITPTGTLLFDDDYRLWNWLTPASIIDKQTDSFQGKLKKDATSPFLWATFQFNEPTEVGSYSLSVAKGNQEKTGGNTSQLPKRFNLWAGNDNAAWTLLDTQAKIAYPTEGFAESTLKFEVANPTAYTYYKLEILDCDRHDFVNITQWQLFAPKYAITVENGTADTYEAIAGTTITVTADVAPDGSVFSKWVSDADELVFADETEATTTFVMLAQNVTVTATYVPLYTITVENGTADLNEAIEGATVTITAGAAPEGQLFLKWESDDVTFDSETSETTTFVMPAQDVTVTATYDLIQSIPYLKESNVLVYAEKGKLIMVSDGRIPATFSVTNVVGQTLTTGTLTKSRYEVSVPAGVYVVKTNGTSKKLVVK